VSVPRSSNKKTMIISIVVIVAVLFILFYMMAPTLFAPQQNMNTAPIDQSITNTPPAVDTNVAPDTNTAPGQMTTTADGLQILIEQQGTGAAARNGDSVSVNYTGTLDNGTVFDSSIPRNQPLTFTLGQGSVIKGWDEGVLGMKIGEKRKLIIPSTLAYGDQAVGGVIPANSRLTFEVELLSIQ
jgi:peptidylprolyl isomerase